MDESLEKALLDMEARDQALRVAALRRPEWRLSRRASTLTRPGPRAGTPSTPKCLIANYHGPVGTQPAVSPSTETKEIT